MGKRCVAYECNNVPSENISCFLFPQEPTLQAARVQRTKDNWTGPTKNSILCSEHFTKDCIEIDTEYTAKYAGQKKQHRLVKGAIPTIFKKKIRHSLLCFI